MQTVMTNHQRVYCTALCPRRGEQTESCDLCYALDMRDAFLWWFAFPKRWLCDLRDAIFGPKGYHLVMGVVMTFVGAYFGLYAVMEARHERRLNRASYERSTFVSLVTSSNRGSFITAMKTFGPTQMMDVPPEPHLWPPWHVSNWWGKASQPNQKPMLTWARNFFDALYTSALRSAHNAKSRGAAQTERTDSN